MPNEESYSQTSMNVSTKIVRNDETKTANSTRILKNSHETHSILRNVTKQHIFIEERGGSKEVENEFSFD